jgi:methyl-accepting chemotaxis protein
MFATMKTGTKVLAGFGIAIAIAVVVGFVGYRGISKLSGHVEDIGQLRLPSVQGVNLIAKGQLSVGYGLRGLLHPEMMESKTRANAYQRCADGLQEAEMGWKMYEPLTKTPEEAALWKEFVTSWGEWKKTADEIIAVSREKDKLVAAGVKLDDAKVLAIDKNAMGIAAGSREAFRNSSAKLEEIIRLNAKAGEDAAKQASADANTSTIAMFTTIGLGAAAMLVLGLFLAKSISKVLRTLIGETVRLSQAAMEGKLQTRGNPELVSAEFRPIVEGVNSTLDSLVMIIDRVPAPFLVIDKDHTIRYMNDVGAKVLGQSKDKIVGTKCYDQFKTPHCKTADCACARAMATKQVVSAETQAHPNGLTLDIAYSGVPMRDAQGNVVGAFEFVTDLTAVKTAARVAKKVADYQNTETHKLAQNLERCAQGDLAIDTDVAEGDADTAAVRESFVLIGNAVGKTARAIRDLANDVKSLGAAAVNGQLDKRADDSKYQGEYREIIRGMNRTLEAFMVPIQDLGAALKRMAQKDFSQVVAAEYPGAYGELRDNVNLVVKNLREAIGQIAESANQFAEGSRVIAESSQTLASGAQEQSSSVEQMTASIEELAKSVDAVKDNATQADQIAKGTSQLAEQGGAAVQKSIEAMDLIKTSSQQISEIIQVIAEIASQTNLLALNAAIEAARAGEHGMGFAVVADEVRKLAERSNQAAREISTLIKESTQRVQEGAQLSAETGQSLQKIVAGVETTAQKIAEIAAATVQQASNAREVATAIQGVAQVTERSAAGSEEMASSSEELGAQSGALRELVAGFRTASSATAV